MLLPSSSSSEIVFDRPYRFFLPVSLGFRVFFWFSTPQLDSLKGTEIFLKRTFDIGEKAMIDASYAALDFLTKPRSSLVLFKVKSDGKISLEAFRLNREREAQNLARLIPEDNVFFQP